MSSTDHHIYFWQKFILYFFLFLRHTFDVYNIHFYYYILPSKHSVYLVDENFNRNKKIYDLLKRPLTRELHKK